MGTVEATTPTNNLPIYLADPPVPAGTSKKFPDPLKPSDVFYTDKIPPNFRLASLTDGDAVADGGDKSQVVEVPVPRTTKEIPTAIQQRYLSQAVDQAIAQMNFGDLTGKQVTLSIAGVMPMSDMDLGGYIRQSLISRIALSGGRVIENGGDTQIVIRVGQSGLDKVEETKTQTQIQAKPRSPVLPIATMVIGGTITLYGVFLIAKGAEGGGSFEIGGGTAVGLTGIGIDVGGFFWLKHNKNHPLTNHPLTIITETHNTNYHMRVSMDATIIPQHGQATTTHGEVDLPITEDSSL